MLTPHTAWINTVDYTTLELILFALGCIGWVVAYVGVALMLRKRKFVEIPAGAVAANIAWEFVWGFLHGSDMGRLFTLGYALWCIQDVYITYAVFKYGHKQIDNPRLAAVFKPAFAFGIVAWGVLIYFYVYGGYDTGYGAMSGYILNVMMSALYINLILKHDPNDFSELVAWSKMLGTALLSVFNMMVRGDDGFLMTLCAFTFLFDVAYIVLFYQRRRAVATRPAPVAA